MIVASTQSCGHDTSPTRTPTSGERSGSVTSYMPAPDAWSSNSLTRSPMLTASSTSAVMIRGVETGTSTPHISSNIHSFFGLLTRATVFGTANSVRAMSERTRLALSSPVAATTTSHSSRRASVSVLISHASPSSQSAFVTLATRIAAGFRSISVTS